MQQPAAFATHLDHEHRSSVTTQRRARAARPIRQCGAFGALHVRMRFFLAAFGCVLLCCVLPVHANDEKVNVSKTLDAFVPILTDAIERKDTQHAIFHGCYDWHSSVHGHWALLRIAKTTSRHADVAETVRARFTKTAVEAELEQLKKHPSFEMPYGRAWFLRLAIEAGGTLDDAARVQSAALLTFLERGLTTPSTREYANDAWALVQLHAYYRHAEDDVGRKRVEAIVRTRFLGAEDLSFGSDTERQEFFSRFGNWVYLVAETMDEKTLAAFLKKHPIANDDLKPIVHASPRAHHFGMNWSRAWALRALSRKGPKADRERFTQAYEAHVRQGLTEFAQFKGNYAAYDHWVPQFAVYALTDS